MENRRSSGLWAQQPGADFYERQQSQQQQQSGPYQYYQPPPARTSLDGKGQGRSFSDRAGQPQPATYQPSQNGVLRSDSRKIRDLAEGVTNKLQRHGPTTSEQLAQTKHINSVGQPPLRIDPNAPPANVRDRAWSPDIVSPRSITHSKGQPEKQQGRQRQASNASELLRKGSVPDRSPLQKLEMEFASKEEKRARMEEAEYKVRQKSVSGKGVVGEGEVLRHGTLRRDEGRVVSDGARRPVDGRRMEGEREVRHASAGQQAQPGAESGSAVFRRASEALRKETNPTNGEQRYEEPSRRDERGYRRAPGVTGTRGDDSLHRQRDGEHTDPRGRYEHDRAPAAAARAEGPSHRQREPEGTTDLNRTQSGKHRLRNAGFAGAAAAMAGAGVAATHESAADRGRAAHERRKSQLMPQDAQASPISPTTQQSDGGFGRSGSKKLQKRPPPATEWYGRGENNFRGPQDQQPHQYDNTAGDAPGVKQQLATNRLASGGANRSDSDAARAFQDADPIPPSQVRASSGKHDTGVKYTIPPQTAAGQQAREQVGFGAEPQSAVHGEQQGKHHRFGGMFHRHGHAEQPHEGPGGPKPLDEWRGAGVARLTSEDFEFEGASSGAATAGASREEGGDAAWWEKEKERGSRRTSSGGSRQAPPQYDGAYEEEAKSFRPPLYLKCGPLLRYTGMRQETAQPSRSGRGGSGGEKEIWRGSIMIVTDDTQSDYSSVPILRIFGQPMDLHTPPPKHLLESGQELPPEYEDPVAGQVKVSRTGRPLYVRPVHDIDGGVDLSREENPQGLYAATRTPVLGPASIAGGDGRESRHITFQDKSRIKRQSGEKAGRYREVRAHRLHTERSVTFWRFNIEIELGSRQHRVAYRINKGPAIGFWVPAKGDTMHIMFHSCNGFSMSVNPNDFSGPDPLWRDVLNRHQVRPFHVMIGGGDQIYNDRVMKEAELFSEWLAIKNPEHKHKAEFTPEMQNELEDFYLNRYAMWFSQGLFGMANSQIPMVNLWDDHDIIDGFGSYPHHFMSSRVFAGLGAVAFKYYMLFQHQSLVAETEKEEPSWLLGASPGPYINELSRSVFVRMGRKVAFVGLDCRTERMRDEILSQESYDLIFDRLRAEIGEGGEVRHLIVLLGVPIAYPRLNFLENILTSRVMDPIKALGRTGMLGGFVNKFDGGVEILDDLDDHWTAKHHKAERNWFIQELQELAAEKSVRVTILGGDVHLGAVGQFYTPKRFGVAKDRDHRYMPNVISSAIVNTPPPAMMAEVLNRRNKVHHLDEETDEDLIRLFDTDVDGSVRGNKCLLPRRNYCAIKEYVPGSTPPGTPRDEAPHFGGMEGVGSPEEREGRDRRFPPGSMKRTMSLTRGPAALVRRLSGSGRSKNPPVSLAPEHVRPYSAQSQDYGAPPGMQRSNSMGAARTDTGSYFPPPGQSEDPPQRPINQFHRRPTTLSVKEVRKAAAKGGAEDGREPGHIDLESGLDISLNLEVDQHDPSGATVPYRMLVPALWYQGSPDVNTARFKGRRASLMDRIRGRIGGPQEHEHHEEDDGEYSRSPTITPPPSAGGHGRQGFGGFDGHDPNTAVFNKESGGGQRRHFSAEQPDPAAYNPTNAYNKGYNLSSPPIGGPSLRQQTNGNAKNNPYPQSGIRHASAPQSRSQQPANEPWRQKDEYTDEGSLTPSDEYSDVQSPPAGSSGRPVQARRPSKAERFFGIGDETGPWGGNVGGAGGGRRPSMQQGDESFDEPVAGKKKPWQIWR